MQDEETGESIYRLPDGLGVDLRRLAELAEGVRSGTVSAGEFRAFRVPRGVYEERKSGNYMVRVRCPGGLLRPEQMRALATASIQYGSGVLHLTTRQDVQIHKVPLEHLGTVLRELQAAGLSSKGSGGNTVRNLTGCGDAGVCVNEAFDVTPYVLALTEALLSRPDSFDLPRKFKIAFSGCGSDCAGTTVNDLGFIAKRQNGQDGFAVYVGGGLGSKPRVADRLEAFIPAGDCLRVAEAVKRAFYQHGDRKNRRQARLRFLIERIGIDKFQELYRSELDQVGLKPLDPTPLKEPESKTPSPSGQHPTGEGFETWQIRNTYHQKQDGFSRVQVPLFLGNISGDRMLDLADVVATFGEGRLRISHRQDAMLRWVRREDLAALYGRLADLGLADVRPKVYRDQLVCAGASTCRLGICLSRGLAEAISETLSTSGLDLDRLDDVTINISGCPNGCGRHPIGMIGLAGMAKRVHGRLAPHYQVRFGGRVGEGRTRLAEGDFVLPARTIPEFLKSLFMRFQESRRLDFQSFLDTQGDSIRTLAGQFSTVPPFDDNSDYYFDWSSQRVFPLPGGGPGECGAGVSELIASDLTGAEDALANRRLFSAVLLGVRALLLTQGEFPVSNVDALVQFHKHFMTDLQNDPLLEKMVSKAEQYAGGMDPDRDFKADTRSVRAFLTTLRDRIEESEVPSEPEMDLRKMCCPPSARKFRQLLEQTKPGQALTILLDEKGASNLTTCLQMDDFELLGVVQEDTHWRVTVRRRVG